jgi:hypothetical protein
VPPLKTCAQCGESFGRKPGISKAQYAKARFCSSLCARRGQVLKGRHCDMCSAPFQPTSVSQLRCGPVCAAEWKAQWKAARAEDPRPKNEWPANAPRFEDVSPQVLEREFRIIGYGRVSAPVRAGNYASALARF